MEMSLVEKEIIRYAQIIYYKDKKDITNISYIKNELYNTFKKEGVLAYLDITAQTQEVEKAIKEGKMSYQGSNIENDILNDIYHMAIFDTILLLSNKIKMITGKDLEAIIINKDHTYYEVKEAFDAVYTNFINYRRIP
ncbi:hypothetical protein ABSA28_00802 [Candidatus Hepatincolaceae symbiont of Richtersius coronifer]